MNFEKAVIIRDKTRLEQLIERFNSKAQARFYIEHSGGDFDFYEHEHETFYRSLNAIQEAISSFLKYKVLDRTFLPTYIFHEKEMIFVIGQDGLVANTAKYVKGLPIIAINPDVEKYDGILLPFSPKDIAGNMKSLINGPLITQQITMAEAVTNDGQRLLAFNDFYIGTSSHVSSRYRIIFDGKVENQSSSGIIVSTGAGSTGWLSSIFNMANNINRLRVNAPAVEGLKMNWEDEKLLFVVREPFQSKVTQTNIGCGMITRNKTLKIDSLMPSKGVIFSDGIEADFLNFNSGSSVEIGVAKEKANLVVEVR